MNLLCHHVPHTRRDSHARAPSSTLSDDQGQSVLCHLIKHPKGIWIPYSYSYSKTFKAQVFSLALVRKRMLFISKLMYNIYSPTHLVLCREICSHLQASEVSWGVDKVGKTLPKTILYLQPWPVHLISQSAESNSSPRNERDIHCFGRSLRIRNGFKIHYTMFSCWERAS